MAALKLVAVLIGIFTREKDGPKVRDYLWNCLTDGMASTLFCDPHILAAFYAAGNTIYDALALAVTNYETNDSSGNHRIMKAKMALAIIWLRSYAAQVQVIANDPAHCTTRQDAADNISTSFLTPQKLVSTSKGVPATPVITAKFAGEGVIEVTITNGPTFKPSSINVVVAGVPVVTDPLAPLPVIALADGQITVTSKVSVPVTTKSVSGKGRSAKMTSMNKCTSYLVAVYAQNGNKLISLLSNVVLVTIVIPVTV